MARIPMEYLSGQLILNERVDVRAVMLHGVIAKDRGTCHTLYTYTRAHTL